MVYKALNPNLPNKRENGISKRIREQKLQMGERYEYERTMYGNVRTITDHERKIYYRQDREIIEQLDLFDEPLPRYCDFCEQQVDAITTVEYKAVYEMIVRSRTNPEIKRDEQIVTYASCVECSADKTEHVPKTLKKGYIYEIYKDGSLVWKRSHLHYKGKITMPWTAI